MNRKNRKTIKSKIKTKPRKETRYFSEEARKAIVKEVAINRKSSVDLNNLDQAQRDYFGAHTYKLIEKEGLFHSR